MSGHAPQADGGGGYLARTGRPVDATDRPTHHLNKPAGGLALLVRAEE